MTNVIQPSLPFGGPKPPAEPLRRCVRRVRLDPDDRGTYTFRARSFTRRSGWSYRCRVNLREGWANCTCRDYRFRRREEGSLCKHLQRAIITARRAERSATGGR